MQREFDLVVTILGGLRDAPAAWLSTAEVVAAVQHPGADAIAEERVLHHLHIMEDAGLVKRMDAVVDTCWRLTWTGYDTLDGDEDDDADV